MRKIFLVTIGLFLAMFFMQAQTDTMYVMKLGDAIGKYNVRTQVDSVIFYKPEDPNSATYISRVHIPAGTFTMGSPDTEVNRDASENLHSVTLTDFYMSKYEITIEQFANFLNARKVGTNRLYAGGMYPTQPLFNGNNYRDMSYDGSKWNPAVGYEKHPMTSVTWYGAAEFAAYAGGNLPTEAQWEYACRAGTATPFNTGNCLSNTDAYYNWLYPYSICTNAVKTTLDKTQSVGKYAANAFGLYDMHGNALEWCADWYGTYPTTAVTNPTGAATGSRRVYRGGAFTSPAKYCRSAWHSSQTPEFYHPSVGFRVVLPETPKNENYDTIYVMKAGAVIEKYNVQNQVDSIIFYKTNQESISRFPGFLGTNSNISIFVEALNLTHLSDSIRKVNDPTYKPTMNFRDEYNTYQIINPAQRKFGYTVLVEPNDVFEANGINSLEDLIQKAKELYPANSIYDNDFTNKRNSLNQYISYHLINKAVYLNKIFYTSDAVKGYTPDEFMETMYTNRIIKASKVNDQIALNPNSGQVVHVQQTGSQTTLNGVYHLLDNMLVYSDGVERMLQNTRIRFDFTSLFPEMTNNQIRGSRNVMTVNNSSGDRYGFEPGYLAGIQTSKDTRLIYLAGKQGQWANYQSDEFMAIGPYDVTLRLLPVPPGTYELRYGYSANSNRTITQIYVDDIPMDIPIDFTIQSSDPRIGYVLDKLTDDNGFENDKMMRNRGYMKSPTTFLYGNTIARDASNILRRIIGTFTFTDYKAHTIRFESTTSDVYKQLVLDYFEYVPESIYSPASGEPESRD